MAGTINAIAINGITTYTSGTVVFSTASFANSNGVSFGTNLSTITASVETSYLGSNRVSDFVAATAAFAGTNATGTIASNGISISVAAPGSGGGAALQGSGAYTQNTGTIQFANSNGITFGLSTNQMTASHNGLTTAMASNRGSDFVQATAALHLTNVSATFNSNDISISVAAQSNQSAIKGLGVSNTGNTSGDTGISTGINWVLAGTNAITVSQSTAVGGPNTIWVSGPTVGGAQTGISGIIASDATYTSGTVSFSAQNNITIGSSVNGATQYIKLSVGDYLTTAALSGDTTKYVQNWKLTSNTAGTTSSAQGTDLWLAGGNNVTISGNSNTIVISAGGVTLSSYDAYDWPGASSGVSAVNNNTTGNNPFWPFTVAENISAGFLQQLVSVNFNTIGTSRGTQTYYFGMGIYTRGTGASSTSLGTYASASFSIAISGNNSSYTFSQPTASSYTGYVYSTTNSSGVNISSLYTGPKVINYPINTLLTPGVYWFGRLVTMATTSTNFGITFSDIGLSAGSAWSQVAPLGSNATAYTTGLDQFGVMPNFARNYSTVGGFTTLQTSADVANLFAAGLNLFPQIRFWST